MKILVLNAGSSSLKYSVFDMTQTQELINGLIERIGSANANHRFTLKSQEPQNLSIQADNHQQALQVLFDTLQQRQIIRDARELAAVGHRVVHGGEHFTQPSVITNSVITQIQTAARLAPLHNPANLLGIEESMRYLAQVPQVAVFDTAFHQTMPDFAYRYALPTTLYQQHGVRRYGFHGTSHFYVAKQAAQFLGKALTACKLITIHLGNGASMTAIANGESVDTSMGLTPLEGLIMGTRSGDLDPALPFYLHRATGLEYAEIEQMLNKNSGCKGLCGENDMRAIHALAEAGDAQAKLTLNMYAYRLKKYIGAYFAALNGVDAIVFTGGIGENDAWMRAACCENLTTLDIVIDPNSNQKPTRPLCDISAGKLPILVINTNEELEIAMQTQQCLNL